METACFGIRQKTGRRPVFCACVFAAKRQNRRKLQKNDDPSMERAKTNGPIRGISRRSVRSVRPETEEAPGTAGTVGTMGSRSGCRTGRVRKKKNVRPCSRTFRCSSLSLSVSWRRERLLNLCYLKISHNCKYLLITNLLQS